MMGLVTAAIFMEILDGNVIVTALPAMAQSFGTSALALNVGVSAYLLALGIFIPASGWVADRFGARTVFACAIAGFTLASALCGATNGLRMFVAVRILQGISGAMMVPVGRLVVLRYTPKDKLMGAMSAMIWPALIAPVIGPPLGGFIAVYASWRWIFYLNVPFGTAALIASFFLIPNIREAHRRPFDMPGFLLCGAGTFALLSGFERVASRVDGLSIGLLLLGIALLVATIGQFRRSAAPMIDLAAYAIPTFRAAVRGGSLSRIAIGSAPFLLPLMFQIGFAYDAIRSGLLVLAVFVGNLAMKSVTTPILRRFGYRPVLIWNGLLTALCLAACALLQPGTPVVVTVAILLVGGMTRSMQFTALGNLAYADVTKQGMSHANTLFSTISQVAMGGGVALAAVGVRAGQAISANLGIVAPGADYRIAFVLLAVCALSGLIDSILLPRGAADHFVT